MILIVRPLRAAKDARGAEIARRSLAARSTPDSGLCLRTSGAQTQTQTRGRRVGASRNLPVVQVENTRGTSK